MYLFNFTNNSFIRSSKVPQLGDLGGNHSNLLPSPLYLLPILLLLLHNPIHAQNFNIVTKATLTNVGNSSSLALDADKDGWSDVFIMGKDGANYYTKLFHNQGDSSFLDLGISFPGLANGSADVIDYNNDGLLDLVMSGTDGAQKRFCLFKNKGNNLFAEVTTSVPGVDYSSVKCTDFNRDGWIDIVVAGQSSQGKIFKIYKNNGNGTFSEAHSFEGLYNGCITLSDINHDSYTDIIATGVDNSLETVSKIYINQNHFAFIERASNITATRGGSVDFIDFNNDGYADIFVTGKKSNNKYISEVFRNNSGESFTFFASLKGLYNSTAAIDDFSNDGFADIIIAGVDTTGITYKTYYYKNNGGAGFTEQATNLPDINQGCIRPIDLTNDHKPDILVSGFTMSGPVARIYNNDISEQNGAPGVPNGLSSFSQNDSAILRWSAPADDHTASKALTFDFYIIAAATGDTIFVLPSNYANGLRHVYRQGDLTDTFVIIKNLSYGKYYWSVQAIDQSYRGSAFSARDSFNICFNFSIGADTGICRGSNIALTAGVPLDVVSWYSSESPAAPFQTGNTASVKVINNTRVWVTVTKAIGCSLSDTINLSVLPLPVTNLRKDNGLCMNSDLTLSLASADYRGNWSSLYGSVSATDTSKVTFKVLRNDQLYVMITAPNGCNNYDTARVTAYRLPSSNLPDGISVCLHDTLNITAGTDGDSVYWYNASHAVLCKERDLSSVVNASETINVKIVDNLKCHNYDTLQVQALALPIANAGLDTLICQGGHAVLGGLYSNQDNYTFQWTPASELDHNNVLHPAATPDTTTSFVMKITDGNSCVSYDTVTVHINPNSIINTGGNKYVCYGKSVELGGNPTATGSKMSYSYIWSPAGSLDNVSVANPTATPEATTLYHLVVLTGGCIIDTFDVNVSVWPLPVVTKSDDIVIGYRESTPIWASGGTNYQWQPEAGLDNSLVSNPTASPLSTTMYMVLVTDSNGCESNAQLTVTIRNEIFVPNLFTPNGDANNDYFKIYGTGIDKIHLQVYNTEGMLVFETSSVEEATVTGWDGTYKGKQLEAGKYLWVLDALSTDGTKLLSNGSNKGIVTLLR